MENEKRPLDWHDFMRGYNRLDAEDQVLLARGCNLTYLYAAVYNDESFDGTLENMRNDAEDWSAVMAGLQKLKTLVDRARDEHPSLKDAAAVVTDTWAPLTYEAKKEFVGYLMADEQFRGIVEDVIYAG